MSMMDEPCAAALPQAPARRLELLSTLVGIFRSRINRRKVSRLDHLTDHELADIGLTRLDVVSALNDSRFFEDPSPRLAKAARRRRGA